VFVGGVPPSIIAAVSLPRVSEKFPRLPFGSSSHQATCAPLHHRLCRSPPSRPCHLSPVPPAAGRSAAADGGDRGGVARLETCSCGAGRGVDEHGRGGGRTRTTASRSAAWTALGQITIHMGRLARAARCGLCSMGARQYVHTPHGRDGLGWDGRAHSHSRKPWLGSQAGVVFTGKLELGWRRLSDGQCAGACRWDASSVPSVRVRGPSSSRTPPSARALPSCARRCAPLRFALTNGIARTRAERSRETLAPPTIAPRRGLETR
jgi:hypothetical protein